MNAHLASRGKYRSGVILVGNETGQAVRQSLHATAGDLLCLRHEGEGT